MAHCTDTYEILIAGRFSQHIISVPRPEQAYVWPETISYVLRKLPEENQITILKSPLVIGKI